MVLLNSQCHYIIGADFDIFSHSSQLTHYFNEFDDLGLISGNKYFRGISSTVRRCIEKETGIEYAAKIIDISNEIQDDGHTMKDATLQEVQILHRVAGHPYISKFSILAFL